MNPWLKRFCVLCSVLMISCCVGLVVGLCLRILEVQDLTQLCTSKDKTQLSPQHNVSEKGTFKSITNGTFAVYNAAGDLLYLMENIRKEDQGDVVFAEFEEYHSSENVVIRIKLIEAPKSVLELVSYQ